MPHDDITWMGGLEPTDPPCADDNGNHEVRNEDHGPPPKRHHNDEDEASSDEDEASSDEEEAGSDWEDPGTPDGSDMKEAAEPPKSALKIRVKRPAQDEACAADDKDMSLAEPVRGSDKGKQCIKRPAQDEACAADDKDMSLAEPVKGSGKGKQRIKRISTDEGNVPKPVKRRRKTTSSAPKVNKDRRIVAASMGSQLKCDFITEAYNALEIRGTQEGFKVSTSTTSKAHHLVMLTRFSVRQWKEQRLRQGASFGQPKSKMAIDRIQVNISVVNRRSNETTQSSTQEFDPLVMDQSTRLPDQGITKIVTDEDEEDDEDEEHPFIHGSDTTKPRCKPDYISPANLLGSKELGIMAFIKNQTDLPDHALELVKDVFIPVIKTVIRMCTSENMAKYYISTPPSLELFKAHASRIMALLPSSESFTTIPTYYNN